MIVKFKQMIEESNSIVFFGGAGVSTESGIPDFRSVDGLYNLKYKYPPEIILSHSFYKKYTSEFYDFYKDKMLYLEAVPNYAHIYLAKLEKEGKLTAIVTQNIDGLHTKAGNKNVIELHGSIYRNYCSKCGEFYNVRDILSHNIPTCNCGGIIKPDVVLYEEGLSDSVMNAAITAISNCDMLIVGGTSLAVYPAASFINFYKGNKLVVINKSTLNVNANLVIIDSIAETFKKLNK